MAVRVSNLTAQALLSPTEFRRFVTHELAFLEEPFRRQIRVANLTAQVLFVQSQPPQSLEDEVAFQQDATNILFIGDYSPTSDILTLTQTLALFGMNAVTDPILFVDVALCDLHKTQVSQQITFADTAEVYNGVPWLGPHIKHFIEFTNTPNRTYTFSVSQPITFTHSTFRRQTVSHAITFVQTVTCGIGQTDAHHVITFAQNVDTGESVWRRNIVDQNVVQQSFTYFTDSLCATKSYNRFDGAGSGAGIPEQRLQTRSTFTLETLTGPKTILVLRNPETDNRDRLAFNRINRETRGGEINIYSDPNWPKVNTLLFTVVALKRTKIDALQQFLQDTLGQEIKLSDWTGTVWHGVITTPGEVATEDGSDAWTLAFEFEGVAYDGQAPDVPLQFQQTASVQGTFRRSGSSPLGLVSTVLGHIIVAIDRSASSVLTFDHEALAVTTVDPVFGTGTVQGVGQLTGVGYRLPHGRGVVEGVGQLTGVGHKEPVGHGVVEGVGQLTGVGRRRSSGQGTVEGVGQLTGVGAKRTKGHGTVEGVGQVNGVGVTPAVPTPTIQVFTANNTWTKPVGAVSVQVLVYGGGGGGGSGRKDATGNQKFGGAGGGGGGFSYRLYSAGSLGSTEPLTVGAGGGGGASQTSNSTSGNIGTAGSTSTFSSSGNLLTSTGGSAGPGGSGAAVSTRTPGGTGSFFNGGEGGCKSSIQSERDVITRNFFAPTGGGGGGWISTLNVTATGGLGGPGRNLTMATYQAEMPDFPLVAAAAESANGSTVTSDTTVNLAGTGGGGGAASTSTNGTAGGAGANYGAGGGGGGASVDGVGNSGAGGAGATGAVIIITYYN